MLLGGGVLIEIVEARVKPLERVLKDYISKRLTGYVVFRNDVQGTYISIALIKGSIVACRAIDRGVVYEGAECSDSAMKYLFQPEGVIEVFETQDNVIIFDLIMFPISRMERKTALITRLGAEVGMPRPTIAQPHTIETVTPTPPAPEVTTPKPELEIAKAVAEAKPLGVVEEPKVEVAKAISAPQTTLPVKAEITISNDCIDPIILYRVMRSSQLLETISQALSFSDLMHRIKSIVKEGKFSYLYVSGNVENLSLRVLYDVQTGNMNIELERNGTTLCGDSAVKELENQYASNIKIWFIQ